MFTRDAERIIGCPDCGHAAVVDDLLAQFESRHSVAHFADGSQESGPTVFEQRCRRCRVSYAVPFKKVQSLVIDRQMQDLFSSISQVLRGRAKLQ